MMRSNGKILILFVLIAALASCQKEYMSPADSGITSNSNKDFNSVLKTSKKTADENPNTSSSDQDVAVGKIAGENITTSVSRGLNVVSVNDSNGDSEEVVGGKDDDTDMIVGGKDDDTDMIVGGKDDDTDMIVGGKDDDTDMIVGGKDDDTDMIINSGDGRQSQEESDSSIEDNEHKVIESNSQVNVSGSKSKKEKIKGTNSSKQK